MKFIRMDVAFVMVVNIVNKFGQMDHDYEPFTQSDRAQTYLLFLTQAVSK